MAFRDALRHLCTVRLLLLLYNDSVGREAFKGETGGQPYRHVEVCSLSLIAKYVDRRLGRRA